MTVVHGRLLSGTSAPPTGERSEEIARIGGVVVEQILSGTLPRPLDYDQTHDEWIMVLAGGAVLVVDGQTLELEGGDWVYLPAHVPHRLVETRAGTTWLALHGLD